MRPPKHEATGAIAGGGRRKAATASREWLVVSSSDNARVEEMGKHALMARTGLPARDLRVLDPLLSYPSTILGRERAIVVNIEHIKAVITACEVLVPNSRDPALSRFAGDLQARLLAAAAAGHRLPGDEYADTYGEAQVEFSTPSTPLINYSESHNLDAPNSNTMVSEMPECRSPCKVDETKDGTKVLPFEFRALEVCLESACRSLEAETTTLEQEAYPALDELTSKISTLNLERVRQIKSRLVALCGRVQKVRDELEHLLDDDLDMAEMYLTEKLQQQRVGESSRIEVDAADTLDENRGEECEDDVTASSRTFTVYKPNIQELEMLLEAYFVQIDGTLNKLSHLRDYVDDTEDYINIMLDDKQNQLLQMGVMLSTATIMLTAGVVVFGVFGMNIHIDLFNQPVDDATAAAANANFWGCTGGTIGAMIIMYILAMFWGKKSGLLQ